MCKPIFIRVAVRCWLAANLLTVLLAAPPKEASAADVYWENVFGPPDWNTAANWNPARVPTGTDNATFDTGGTANYSTNVTDTFADIRFGDGGSNIGGTVNQSAGTINGIWLRMNMSGNANSTYNLSGGSATFARINVNEAAGSGVSTLNIQGGTLTVPQSSAGGGQGALFIGGGVQGLSPINNANVNVSSGTLTVGGDTADNQSIVVGTGGDTVAALNVSGGTVNVVNSGDMIVGDTSPGAVNQTGGVVNLFTGIGASSWLYVGGYVNPGTNAAGTYTLSGGTLSDPNRLEIAHLAGSAGTFELDGGGTATVGLIQGGAGTSVFNFNGGTLTPSASNSTFMQGLTTANVRNGGTMIDTNGFNVTISQALVHSTISGDNAIDGGLTKRGAGTLTLTGASTYTGPTNVFGGALFVSANNGFYFTNGADYTVSGTGTIFGLSGAGTLIIGEGTMTVNFGALLLPSGALTIGGELVGGTLVVDGAGSSVPLGPNSNFTLGSSFSSGALTVSNNGTFTVGTGGTSNILNGTININGGSVDLKTLNYSSGRINFTSGALSFLGNLEVGPSGPLGPNLTLNGTQTLTLNGTTLVDNGHVLTLDGGTLSTGGLTVFNGGAFNFIAGTLTITSTSASVNYPIVTNSTSTININADNVSLGDGSLTGFNHGGILNINGPYTLTLNSASYARLGVLDCAVRRRRHPY
jgi:autotransporter-associated beta strand protein